MNKKSFNVQITKSANPRYAADFVLSSSDPDRVGDTIDPKVYSDISRKTKTLIALWQHSSKDVVGAWENLRQEGNKLIGSLRTASTGLGKMVKTLLDEDIPLAASIGFMGSGEPNKHGGIHFTKMDLTETSIVSTPCHPKAQRIAKSFGFELPEEPVGGGSSNAAPLGITDTQKAIQALKAPLGEQL